MKLRHCNLETIIGKIDNVITHWSLRSLTPIGKILVVNSLLISQAIYKLTCLFSPKDDFFQTYLEENN